VIRDFDGTAEYWKGVLEGLPAGDEPRRAAAQRLHDEAADWVARLPARPAETFDSAGWFRTAAAFDPPRICTRLGGPWSEGIDAAGALLTLHEALEAKSAHVLLRADDRPLVIQESRQAGTGWLAVANGTFLLNEALVNPARRPLAQRMVEWAGGENCRVALLEGSFVLARSEGPPSLFDLLARVPFLRWVALHIGVAGLLAALARAPRLGRPRDEPERASGRPAAHAEALGALLARVGDAQAARALLDGYRHWRHPGTPLAQRTK
jgi:hypothetical protein